MVWPPAGFVCLMAAVFFHANLASGQNDSCVTGLPMADAGTFEINGSDFPSRNASVGLQVIIPGAAFTCHGYITSWSALIANFFYRYVTDSIETEIYFQLWRPVDGKYVLIDDDVVVISAQEITNEDGVDVINVMEEVQYLNFSGRVAEGITRMYFQPGDVLGYFAPSFGFNKLGADLTFRTPTPDSSEPTVDVFYVNTSSGMTQPCEISVCGEAVSMIQSVIPQLSVAYEVIDPGTTMTPQLMCTDLEFEACPVTDVPHSPTPSITPSVVVPPLTSPNPESSSLPCADCGSKSTSDTFYTYIIAGIVAFVVITFIGIIIMFILCCKFCIYRRDKTYQDNQDYASPEDFIQLHEPLPRVPHYTSGNGALYALPNRDGDRNTALDNETLFDGSCYASTYQTNGRQHTYQEVSGTPTHHTGGVANGHDFSPTVLGRFDRHGSTQSEMFMNRSLRLHSHSSQTSVSMDTRRPSMPVRLTSAGSGSHVSVNSPPVRIPRVRLASASYSSPQFPYNDLFPLEEPPSCHPARSHTLPVSHPEESPAPPSVVSHTQSALRPSFGLSL